MDAATTKYKVRCCSKCPGDVVYFCEYCQCDLCLQCKEKHTKDLLTIDHYVVIHSDKFNQEQEIYVRDPNNVRTVCKKKQQQLEGTFFTIISEALFYGPVLLTDIKSDIQISLSECSKYQSELLSFAQNLKNCIDNSRSGFNFKHRCLNQKMKMITHLTNTERYEQIYEQSAINPVQFLLLKKTACLRQINLAYHTSKHAMTESLNKNDVIELLTDIYITQKERHHLGNDRLLKLMPCPELNESFRIPLLDYCSHIANVAFDQLWASDSFGFILTNANGEILHRLKEHFVYDSGFYTINNLSELIYIGFDSNIMKLSENMETTTVFIETAELLLKPQCVYWSPLSGDLLVAMYRDYVGAIFRFNQNGQLIQVIDHKEENLVLIREPRYITENNNWDIVVSYPAAVVGIEGGGRHRFSYRGHPSGARLDASGICTDALSNILVCDHITATVQMLDSDGQFLSYLLIRPPGIFTPRSLSYDANTHRLWVGSEDNNTVNVYDYIARQECFTGRNPTTHNVKDLQSETLTTEGENTQEGKNECPLTLSSAPSMYHSIKKTYILRCVHISCVTLDTAWVSDDRDNLILTNTKGDILYRFEDFECPSYGFHTVNKTGELVYIDMNCNINKLSVDMKTNITLIEGTNSTWEPQCVYCSISNDDLLVGIMCNDTGRSKVSRYDQSGQLTHSIQRDNTCMDLFKYPIYITENNNGDVVVCDVDAVVVTERGGRHRFSYTGLSGSVLAPRGICTDALSHILVCDYETKTVHMIDKDGNFLSHLLKQSKVINEPLSLSYDVNTHKLWVGTGPFDDYFHVYKYLSRQDEQTNDHEDCPDEDMPFKDQDQSDSETENENSPPKLDRETLDSVLESCKQT